MGSRILRERLHKEKGDAGAGMRRAVNGKLFRASSRVMDLLLPSLLICTVRYIDMIRHEIK